MASARRVTFPKAGEKHRFRPVIRAREAILSLHEGVVPRVPKRFVFVYDRNFEKKLAERLDLEPAPGPYSLARSCRIARNGSLALARLGIGAPMTAVAAEELIAMGARSFLILGTAGGLEKPRGGQLVLCSKALRDEGTSHHYLPNSTYAHPDPGLTEALESAMRRSGIDFVKGPSWTIDAPYMESREELKMYAGEGILTVEMEAAALFAVAKVRRAKAAAVFLVSDVLTEKGWSGFVAGRKGADLDRVASVARAFALLGKRY